MNNQYNNLKKSFRAALLFAFLFIASTIILHAQTTSWTGKNSISWTTSGNWSNGVPTSTVDAIIGDANFTGTRQPTINSSAVCKSLTIGGSKTSTLTVNSSLTINGDLAISSNGTVSQRSVTLTIKGNWSNSGTYTNISKSSGSKVSNVIFAGSNQSVTAGAATTFSKATINSGATVTLYSNIAISHSLIVHGILDPGNPAKQITGNRPISVSATGILKVSAPVITDNYNTSVITLDAGSAVDYSSTTGTQTISNGYTYSTLKISGTGSKLLTANLPALSAADSSVGNIYVVSGTLDLAGFTANRGTTIAGGTISVSNGATIRIGGTNTFPANFATNALSLTSMVEYYGGAQTVSLKNYGNLTLSTFGGAATKTFPASAMTIAGNFVSVVGAGGTSVSYTAGAALTVNGFVHIGAATTFNGGNFTHTLLGNWVNNGTFAGNTSTINANGSGASFSGTGVNNFHNLIFSSSNVSAASNTIINISGNLSTSGAGTFTHAAGGLTTLSGATKTISGAGLTFDNFTVSGSVSSNNYIVVNGNLTVSGSFSNSGTVVMAGSSKTISGTGSISFGSLTVSGSVTNTSNLSLSSSLDVSGMLSASAGTVTFTGTSTLNGTANLFNVTLNGTSLQLSTNAVLGIAGIYSVTSGTLNVTSTTPNTVNFNGSGAQSVRGGIYHHLLISNGNIKTAASSIVTNGDIIIGASTTFAASSNTLTVNGNWSNKGIFSAGSGTVMFVGNNEASISGATTFNILTISKTSASNNVDVLNNISVPVINMINGSMNVGSNTLTITNTRTGNGSIFGNIQRTHAFTTGVSYAFASPVNTLKFSAVSGVTSVIVNATKGGVSDFPFGGSINRIYNITIASGTYTAALGLHYEDDELNGNNESSIQLWNAGSLWALSGKTTNKVDSNFVEKSGLTNVNGRWTLSDNANVVRWNGSVSSDWFNAANWTSVQGSASMPPTANETVQLGTASFVNQPVVNNSSTVKSIVFGSAQPVLLNIAAGGSLTTLGNLSGNWSSNAIHTINAGNQSLSVNGDLMLSDGITGHSINLNVGAGTANIAGSLTQSGGATIAFTSAGVLQIGHDFFYTNGTFLAGSGTISYNGTTSQVVAGLTYNNLTINKASGIAILNASASVAGNLSVSTGKLDLQNMLTVSGNVSIAAAAILNNNGFATTVGGNWNNSGNYVSANGSVTFNGTGAQSISPTTFNILHINKPSGTATLTGNVSVTGNISVISGTFDFSTYTANRTSMGGSITASDNASLIFSGSNNFPANYSTYSFSAGSNVHYNGTVAQTIAGITYGHLTLSNGGTNVKSLQASVIAAGDLTINSGVNFHALTYALNLFGNLNNNGTFSADSSTVLLNGAGKSINGNTTFNKVGVYGSYIVNSSIITFNGSLRIISGGSFRAGTATAIVNSDLINNGILISNGVTNFTGTKPQTISFTNAITSDSKGVINFNGSVPPVLNSTSSPTFATLNINNTGGVSASVDWTVYVAFNVSSGATFNGGVSRHNFYGSFTNNGTITSAGIINISPITPQTVQLNGTGFSSTGTVVFGGTVPVNVTGTPVLKNVTINNPAGVSTSAGWAIGGNLSINNNGVFNAGSNTYTVAGNIESSGTLNEGTSSFTMTTRGTSIAGNANTTFYNFTATDSITVLSDFNVTRNFTNNKHVDASAGAIIMTGSHASIIGGTANPYILSNFVIQKTAGAAATIAANIADVNNLAIESGTLDASTFSITQDNSAEAVNSLTIANHAALKIAGTNSLPSFTSYSIDTLSTVEYAGSTQVISSVTPYGNLVISAAGTKTATAALKILNNFNLSNGTFVPGNFVDTLEGNWIMTGGTFTSTGSTVIFSGATTQSIASTGAFNNVTINKTGGVALLASDMNVNATLTFRKGNIQTGTNRVIIASSGAVALAAQSTGWVNGKIRKHFTSGTNVTRTYELGDSVQYSPLLLNMLSVTAAGNVTAGLRSADHPLVSESGVDGLKSVNKHWTITNNGLSFTSASVTFNWLANDLDPATVQANFKMAKLQGDWTWPVVSNITSTSMQATGMTTLGDFVIGELSSAIVWTGAISSDWSNSGNWLKGVNPNNIANIVVPSGLLNYPVITANVEVNDVTINTGATITVDLGTLRVKGLITANGGSIVSTFGKVELAGTTSQTIPAGLFSSNSVKDLVISNPAGVSLAGPLRVLATLSFGNVNNSSFITGGHLTLASSASRTARLTDITNGGVNSGNNISGLVTIERFVPAKRAYRFLTVPVNTLSSIRTNWMENTNNPTPLENKNPVPNYGTHITGNGGSSNGFDATNTNNPSLFHFNNSTQSWIAATSTSSQFVVGNAYRLFLRGSRSTVMSDIIAAPSPTTLRATGTLVTGTVAMKKAGAGATAGTPELSSVTGGYSLIGNPYASVIDWNSVEKTDISGTIYTFDPTISGSNGRGAYVAFNTIMGTINNPSSHINNYIQSGQAFFVQSTGSNPSITFKETHKAGTQRAVFREVKTIPRISVQLLLPGEQSQQNAADAFSAYFANDFDSSIGNEDSYKFTNQDENIGIVRNGKVLSIEGRKPVLLKDTLPFRMWQLTQKNYILKVDLASFAPNVEGFLEDAYLHTSTKLHNDTVTLVPFSITSDAASVANDRFRVVFETFVTLPVDISGMKAYGKNNGVQVEWTAESENNMDSYELEKSADAQQFVTAATIKAKNNAGISSLYNWFDANPFTGNNYYRVKCRAISGKIKYSTIARVQLEKADGITVASNMIQGNSINLVFKNMEKGNYHISLINSAGQKMYSGTISHTTGSATETVRIHNYLPAGIYQLQVFNGDKIHNIRMIAQ